MKLPTLFIALALGLPSIIQLSACAEEPFAPDQSKLPATPPEGAIILYGPDVEPQFLSKSGGKIDWPVEDGALVSTRGSERSNHIVSKWHFRDADIHVEFAVAKEGPGNSGVYIHGNYELQIFNSFGKEQIDDHEEGAIYGFHKPLVNASRPAGEWQVYDIRYRAPRRDAEGKITAEGSITAWLNGKKIHDNARFGEPRSVYHPYRYNTTPYLEAIWKQQIATQVGPVFLQDHDSPARFRNVWIRPLDDKAVLYEAK